MTAPQNRPVASLDDSALEKEFDHTLVYFAMADDPAGAPNAELAQQHRDLVARNGDYRKHFESFSACFRRLAQGFSFEQTMADLTPKMALRFAANVAFHVPSVFIVRSNEKHLYGIYRDSGVAGVRIPVME